jgi:hypothetical protein
MSHRAEANSAPGGDPWEDILTLSREMLDHARRADWGEVSALQTRRFARIRRFLDGPRSPAELDRLRAEVSTLVDLDAEVTCLAARARHELTEMLRRLQQGKAARRAYGTRG